MPYPPLQDLVFESERYTPLRANSLAKLCLVLFTRHFALLASTHDVMVNCYCPGFVATTDVDHNTDFVTAGIRRVAGFLVGRVSVWRINNVIYACIMYIA